eukprot:scaffold50788_cov68-Phaeocystis_antarctica.AAC.3
MEPQAKYYQQVSSTLYMVVVRYHLDDATALPAKEREALRAAFAEAKLPPIIVETLCFVSADLKQDNAFVRHVNDKYVVPYMQSLGNFNTHYARSDGCKGQFKNAVHFDWVSRRQNETGVRTDWSFFCSCHGKCDCDPEGGAIKTAASNFENKGDLQGVRVQHKLPDSAAFVKFATYGSPADSPHGRHSGLVYPAKSLRSRLCLGKRDAIYRRSFVLVPTAGPQSVNRTYSECKLEGSSRWHSFVDVGEPGRVLVRTRSCHQCDNCFAGCVSSMCYDQMRFGVAKNVPIARPKKAESSLSRMLKSAGERTPEEMAPDLMPGMMLCIAVEGSEHEPWMLGQLSCEITKATESDVEAMQELGYKGVRLGQRVLRLTKFEPFAVGSRKFIETKVSIVSPLSALRRHKLESNAEKALRKPVTFLSSRFGTKTFELKEVDLRAIVAIVMKDKNGGIGDFKVERLDDYRVVMQRGKPVDQWLVKWCGWERECDLTWEPRSHFTDPKHLQCADELRLRTPSGLQRKLQRPRKPASRLQRH